MKYFSIWLPSLKEREPFIKKLETDIGEPIHICRAINGKDHVDLFRGFRHILSSKVITPGMIGCLLSHISLLRNISENSVIFEDDCEFVGKKTDLDSYIHDLSYADILCLATSENVDYTLVPNKEYVSITRFWGTHALRITKKAALAIIATFEKYYAQRIFLPADWLYSYAIKEHGLIAFAPSNPREYFDYKRNIYSAVLERIR